MDGQGADLEARIADYGKRVEGQKTYYGRKAGYYKSRFTFFRVVSTLSAVLIPVVSGITLPTLPLLGTTSLDVARAATTILGLIVAVTVSLEGVLHYRELWQNYRTTEQFLESQVYLFTNLVDPYGGQSREEAFRRFVERIESAIRNENEITLNVLTRVEPSSHPPDPARADLPR